MCLGEDRTNPFFSTVATLGQSFVKHTKGWRVVWPSNLEGIKLTKSMSHSKIGNNVRAISGFWMIWYVTELKGECIWMCTYSSNEARSAYAYLQSAIHNSTSKRCFNLTYGTVKDDSTENWGQTVSDGSSHQAQITDVEVFGKVPTVSSLKSSPFATEEVVTVNNSSFSAELHSTHTHGGEQYPGHTTYFTLVNKPRLDKVLTLGQKIKCPIYTYIQTPIPSLLCPLILKMAFRL